MNLEIRDASATDAETIARFNSLLAEETEGRPLAPGVIGPGVTEILTDSAKGRYWVALDGRQIVGQIMVTYEWSDWRNGMLWWIQSVYIHGDYRRRGIFSALYRHVESLASAAAGVRGLRLYVENDNKRAQETYLALGMSDPRYRVMESIFEE